MYAMNDDTDGAGGAAPAQSSNAARDALAAQIRATYGGDWDAEGVDRAAELADLMYAKGITKLGDIQLVDTDGGQQLVMDGKNYGFLGDYNNDGSFGSKASDYLQDSNRIAWSARGNGNVSYTVGTNPETGKTEIRPNWARSGIGGFLGDLAKIPGSPEAVTYSVGQGMANNASWNPYSQNGASVWDIGALGTQNSQDEDHRIAGRAIGTAIGGYFAAPALSAAQGGGALGSTLAGAELGAATGYAQTGNTEGTLRGGLIGGIGGYVGSQISGAGSADPYGPGSNWGQDTLTNMGYSPAEIAAIQSGAATVGDAGGIKWGGSGGIDDFTQWAADDSVSLPRTQPGGPAAPTGGLNGNPVDDYITRGGASDGSVPSGNGGYSEATFDGVEQPGMYNGAPPVTTTPNFPEQTVTVRPPSDNVTPPPPAGGLPTLPPPGTNIPTTPVVTSPALPDVPKPNDVEVKGKTDLEKFWDWAKANPKLAMQLFGLGASAFGGGNSNNPGAGGPGTGPQAGMTSTPAAPLNRHYVAPPAGYRPGFDPEWQYFQSGPAPATPQGTTSTTQPVQGRTGIASVSNTPAFTPGSTIGSSDVKKPLNTRTYVPGPTANMSMDGAPIAPAAPPATPFAGVQGEGGGAPAAANYTWGGAGERQLAYNRGQDVMPMGIKNLADANAQGYFQARDAADGQWVWAKAGDMKAYDTTGMAMQSNGFGTLIPEHSANKNTPK